MGPLSINSKTETGSLLVGKQIARTARLQENAIQFTAIMK